MLDRKELENRLRKAKPAMAAAFALRVSLRILPILGSGPAKKLPRWHKERLADCLFRVVRAQQAGVLASIYATDVAHDASGWATQNAVLRAGYDSANVASASAFAYLYDDITYGSDAYSAADSAAAVARTAAYAAFAAVNRLGVNSTTDAVSAADAAVQAAGLHTAFINILNKEIKELEKTEHVISYLSLPLWPLGTPDGFRSLWDHLQNAIRSLGAGFEDWIEWCSGSHSITI